MRTRDRPKRHSGFFAGLMALACLGGYASRARSEVPASPKRALPDYDGRGTAPKRASDYWLWGPRVLASPLYLLSEYVVRRPIGALVVTAERDQWPAQLLDFFTFGEDRRAGLIPTALIDFGFRPSVGVYFFCDRAIVRENAIRVHLATWGLDWLRGTITDRISIAGEDVVLSLRAEAERRSDQLHFGMGPRAPNEARSRYAIERFDASVRLATRFSRGGTLQGITGARSTSFREGGCCSDPLLSDNISAGRVDAPPGYGQSYHLGYQRLELALDSREPRPSPGSGVRFEAFSEQALNVAAPVHHHFFRYGATLGGFVDLNDRWRVLSLAVSALFADPIRPHEPIPFTEQVSLGGKGLMRGYLQGRLTDRSALVATIQYQWPIWVWLDADMQLSVGNVFGEHLSGFDPRLLRLSWATGFRTTGQPDHAFEALVGFGTETFESGARITSVRVVFGATNGF